MLYEQSIIKNVLHTTLRSTKSTKLSDCYTSFLFEAQVKMRFVLATLKDTQNENNIFIRMEDLINNQKKQFIPYFQVKVDNNAYVAYSKRRFNYSTIQLSRVRVRTKILK